MLPTLKVRGTVIIKNIGDRNNDSSFDNLKLGDIIVFRSDSKTPEREQRIIAHGIIETINEDTDKDGHYTRIIGTEGENNPISYPELDYPITKQDYIG
jgi:signal peptidase